MGDHKVQPKRTGRWAVCQVCGRVVIYVRHTRMIRGPHWRHASYQQSAMYLNLINPNGRL